MEAKFRGKKVGTGLQVRECHDKREPGRISDFDPAGIRRVCRPTGTRAPVTKPVHTAPRTRHHPRLRASQTHQPPLATTATGLSAYRTTAGNTAPPKAGLEIFTRQDTANVTKKPGPGPHRSAFTGKISRRASCRCLIRLRPCWWYVACARNARCTRASAVSCAAVYVCVMMILFSVALTCLERRCGACVVCFAAVA